jgi:hypothetical protein
MYVGIKGMYVGIKVWLMRDLEVAKKTFIDKRRCLEM